MQNSLRWQDPDTVAANAKPNLLQGSVRQGNQTQQKDYTKGEYVLKACQRRIGMLQVECKNAYASP